MPVNNANLTPVGDKGGCERTSCILHIVLVFGFFFNPTIKVGGEKKGKKNQLGKYLHKLTAVMEMEFTNRKCERIYEKTKWNNQRTVSKNCM